MNYTEEEIDRYIKILKSVDKSPPPSPQSNTVTCKNCHCSDFFYSIRLLLLLKLFSLSRTCSWLL